MLRSFSLFVMAAADCRFYFTVKFQQSLLHSKVLAESVSLLPVVSLSHSAVIIPFIVANHNDRSIYAFNARILILGSFTVRFVVVYNCDEGVSGHEDYC